MFCQNCGKEVGDDDRFCPNCGVIIGYTNDKERSVEQQQEPASPRQESAYTSYDQQSRPAGSKKAVTGILIGVVSAVGVIALFVLLLLFVSARQGASRQLDHWKEEFRDNSERLYEFDREDDRENDSDFGLDWEDEYGYNEIF